MQSKESVSKSNQSRGEKRRFFHCVERVRNVISNLTTISSHIFHKRRETVYDRFDEEKIYDQEIEGRPSIRKARTLYQMELSNNLEGFHIEVLSGQMDGERFLKKKSSICIISVKEYLNSPKA